MSDTLYSFEGAKTKECTLKSK